MLYVLDGEAEGRDAGADAAPVRAGLGHGRGRPRDCRAVGNRFRALGGRLEVKHGIVHGAVDVPQAAGGWIDREAEEFLRAGVIEPSASEFSVSPLIQQKPDGRGSLVLDVRKPNAATTYDSYPLPHPSHVYDTLVGGKLFSSYDFKDGFYGIGLSRDSRKYTAFRTVFGLFQFGRLVQGGKNSAQTFQRVANENFDGWCGY